MTPEQVQDALRRVEQVYRRQDMRALRNDLIELQSIGQAAAALPDRRHLSDARKTFDRVANRLDDLQREEKREMLKRQREELHVLEMQHQIPRRAF